MPPVDLLPGAAQQLSGGLRCGRGRLLDDGDDGVIGCASSRLASNDRRGASADRPPFLEMARVLIKRRSCGLAYLGSGQKTVRFHPRLGFRGSHGRSLLLAVVATDAADGDGKFGQPAAPGAESVAEHAKRVMGASESVIAVMLRLVGVVVDGPEQPSGASTSVPPRSQQSPGAPQRYPGYPLWSRSRTRSGCHFARE